MAMRHWVTQLDQEASARRDQSSFHVFAEGQHSDLRGQIFNLAEDEEVAIWHDRWPRHLFIVIGISGEVEAIIEGANHSLRAHTQLVVAPSTPCRLKARTPASVEILSLLSTAPGP